jgi:glycosyltransferase involved in cell wall biosynthesis
MNSPENKEKTFVSFVVCVTNEEQSADAFLRELHDFASSRFELWEIVVIDNGSSDQTALALNEAAKSFKGGLIVITLPWVHDTELAILAGTDLAVGDLVYEIESTVRDWPFEVLWELYSKSVTGFDIVSAVPNLPLRLGSRLFYYILNRVSYLKLDLTTEELRIVSRRALNAVLSSKQTVRYRKALYKSSGFPGANVIYPSSHKTRPRPEEDLGKRIGLAFDVLISFSNIGFQLGLILSIAFFAVSIWIGFYAIGSYLFRKTIPQGWTSLALFLSFGFSGLFLVLGLLGKYLSIALLEIQNRPSYRVSSVTRIQKN